MNTPNNETNGIAIKNVEDISPHNKALYEAGKNLLIESVEVGREFCKFMTTTSLAAIPAYIALLKLILPKDYSLQNYDEVLFLAPPLLFLVASLVFALGYFPQKEQLSLDLPAEIEQKRGKTIARRHLYAIIGFLTLCIGIILGSWVLVRRLAT